MRTPLIITCETSGSMAQRTQSPKFPATPKEQAEAASGAVQAGASAIHVHVREDDGKPTMRLQRFKETIEAIQAAVPEVLIEASTGGLSGEPFENRLNVVSLKPDVATLNIGSSNFFDTVYINQPQDVRTLAKAMTQAGVTPKIEIFEAGNMEMALRLYQEGILQAPLNFTFALGFSGPMSGSINNLAFLVNLFERGVPPGCGMWSVAGYGEAGLPMAYHAIAMGGHVYTGFELGVYYGVNQLAESNAQLTARIARLAREAGREIATPEMARKLMGIKSKTVHSAAS